MGVFLYIVVMKPIVRNVLTICLAGVCIYLVTLEETVAASILATITMFIYFYHLLESGKKG